MHCRIVRGALALAVLVPARAAAQQVAAPARPHREGSFELSVGVGGSLLDEKVSSGCCVPGLSSLNRLTPVGVVRLGYNFTDRWNFSIGTGVGYSSPATFIQPLGAITWTPDLNATTSPFLTLGGGVTSVLWNTSGYTRGLWYFTGQYGAHLGIGIRRTLSERMALRLEVREQVEHYSLPSRPVFTTTSTVGFSWFLGRQAVASVAVNPQTATLGSLGVTQQLSASPVERRGRRLEGRAVTWASSDESVAVVSPTGVVTAVADGHATISAVSERVTGRANVTVAQTAASVAVAPATATLDALGATQELTAAARDANDNAFPGAPFTWTSSDTAVATVSPSGLVTSVGNGTARITAASGGGGASAAITVAQTTASVSVTPAAVTVSRRGGTVQLAAQAMDANGRPIAGKTVTWTSDAAGVATVSRAGMATSVANGVAHVTASADGRTASATVTVRVAPIELPAVHAALVLRGVSFPPGSSRLTPAAQAALRPVAAALRELPDARWQLAGYTNSLGSALSNRRLSRQRAEAVKAYLESLGVPATSLTAVGYGPQNPIASNLTRAGRLQNTRTEILRLQ
jgi:outer membrane protein OmpA-like peptidoglycan-associated protein